MTPKQIMIMILLVICFLSVIGLIFFLLEAIVSGRYNQSLLHDLLKELE